ncbi:MAG: anhydro-N-acetylmuramic acid kinase [Brevirhabdus sp.]
MLKDGAVWALGAMSGTSLDGVDAAMVRTDGETIFGFGESAYLERSRADRDRIAAVFGHWPGDAGLEEVAELVEGEHVQLLSRFRQAEIIGFHGQTIAHDPRGRGTHQLGDGRVLAEVLGKPVVWDFRSADVGMGGEGAPLASFYHFACAKWIGADAPVVFLNLGGVGNLTWIDPAKSMPEDQGALLAFDTGPANAPVDDLMRARLGKRFDEGGALAATGTVDQAVLDVFQAHPYFSRVPPKSLDRNEFDTVLATAKGLTDADAAATLTEAAAMAVADGLSACPEPPKRVLVTGGGRRNIHLMARIKARSRIETLPVEEVGLDGDMLEAQAFAFLAVRVARGLPTSCPSTTGVAAAVGGGVVSRPGTMD